ncbi:MAG: single-stranded DNA-binding protein [delta proteobacterium ML8_D]|jgi:single-strand DNA-binding protein|nr:MAG: single-stranded DNA-binding protein [delta proteobacterium ML8_D]
MAKGLNKVLLIGRLGTDPEIRYTSDGTAVANFSMATNRSIKRGDQWEEETDWHRIVAWRRLAEICGEYLRKGSNVFVEGQIRTRSWEDRDGNKRWTTEVVAKDMVMLDSKGDKALGTAADLEPPQPPIEDDVPF